MYYMEQSASQREAGPIGITYKGRMQFFSNPQRPRLFSSWTQLQLTMQFRQNCSSMANKTEAGYKNEQVKREP